MDPRRSRITVGGGDSRISSRIFTLTRSSSKIFKGLWKEFTEFDGV